MQNAKVKSLKNMQKEFKFKEGDFVEIIDKKGKRYIFRLQKGKEFCFHQGKIEHNQIIGKEKGSLILTSRGEKVFVFSPLLLNFVLKMKRGAQIIYPKDIGHILVWGEIYPGLKILEAGTGSGALTIFLLKFTQGKGKIISYERRKEFLENAKRNIKNYFGTLPANLILRQRDIYKEGILKEDYNLDRIIFDLPEPWRALKFAKEALKPGGILICYNPTTIQMYQIKEELDKIGGFYFEGMFEILQRRWKIEKNSIRPVDRMVAHTGFIFVARKTSS